MKIINTNLSNSIPNTNSIWFYLWCLMADKRAVEEPAVPQDDKGQERKKAYN